MLRRDRHREVGKHTAAATMNKMFLKTKTKNLQKQKMKKVTKKYTKNSQFVFSSFEKR